MYKTKYIIEEFQNGVTLTKTNQWIGELDNDQDPGTACHESVEERLVYEFESDMSDQKEDLQNIVYLLYKLSNDLRPTFHRDEYRINIEVVEDKDND